MKRAVRRSLWGVLAGLATVSPVFLASAFAHEGHDHGAPPPPVSATIAPRFDAASNALELVGVLRGGRLMLHLDRFTGQAPLAEAQIEVETPAGSKKAQALGGGAFTLDAPWAKPGKVEIIASVTAGGDVDVLSASLTVPETRDAPPVGPSDIAQRLGDGALFVPKTSQKILGLRNQMTAVAEHARTTALPGRIIPDPDASGVVQASVAGRLAPPPGGFPRLGARVKTGDVLALVMPAIASADLTTQAQQARELDQAILLAQRKLERYRAAASAFPRAQLEDAEVELSGLKRRRAGLDSAPKEPERLTAPVDGVVASSNAVAGQIAETSAVLFQIADPDRLWVEALSYASAPDAQKASLLAGDKALALTFAGAGLAGQGQAVPQHFTLPKGASGFRLGQLVSVMAQTGERQRGIALPRAAVLRAPSGMAIVFEQTGAERFVPREVRIEPLDGAQVLVLSGLEAGKRIVIEGAELLNQIR